MNRKQEPHRGASPMTTDITERGFERLICAALTGHACDPPAARTVGEAPAVYGGVGWSS